MHNLLDAAFVQCFDEGLAILAVTDAAHENNLASRAILFHNVIASSAGV
jgi:hypothetical protein